MIFRALFTAELAIGCVLAIGCGRTELGQVSMVGAGGAGDVGGAASGPCAEAICLTSLFQTCVPQGSCTVHGGSSPSASFNTGCYANGVGVSYVGSYSGPDVTRSLSVRRNGVLCYSIDTSISPDASAVTYVVRGANGEAVATGNTIDKSGSVTLTCTGSTPTSVSRDCLVPVGDSSGCDPGTCP